MSQVTPSWLKLKGGRKAAFYLLVVMGLLGLFKLIPPTTRFQQRAESVAEAPRQARISNIHPRGFTVTWLTPTKTKGTVVYHQQQEKIEKNTDNSPQQVDEQGDEARFTHSVRVGELEPGKKYYFKILVNDQPYYRSVDNEWRESGVTTSVNLPPTNTAPLGATSQESNALDGCPSLNQEDRNSCYRPNPVYGQIQQPDSTPAKQALVYLEIPGQSNLLSSLTDGQGRWVIDLANLRRADLTQPLAYWPGTDHLLITAKGELGQNQVYRPIPKVNDLAPGNLELFNPILITLAGFPPPQPTSTPLPTSSTTPTPASTPTVTSPPTLTPVGTLQLQLGVGNKESSEILARVQLARGTDLILNQKLKLALQNNLYQVKLPLWQTGGFLLSVKPDGYLKKELGEITITSGENQAKFDRIGWSAGDLNADEKINSLDIALLIKKYGRKVNQLDPVDLNGDQLINGADLSLLTGNYGVLR